MSDTVSGANPAPGHSARKTTLRAARWVAIAVVVMVVLLLARRIPIAEALDGIRRSVQGTGPWGPLVFGIVYVLCVVALVPASGLTLGAGAIFGPIVGTITTSIASTTGAALAFLIARYLARDAVSQRLGRSPRFAAIDRAISRRGAMIVALLRLSPAVPFNLQNYLYGLTGIGFWTCTLTSWVAMLPGTLLYVWLGHAGRLGVEAASGRRGRTPIEWAFLGIGLLATLAVTLLLTRMARRAIAESHELDTDPAAVA